MWYQWRPYVPVAERRRKAEREMAKLRKKGHRVSPVVIEGRTIAQTFWGKAWCDNLERYSDFENRLPRGRTYVRNGSVVDLQIAPGEVMALVSGSEIYKVAVKVSAIPKARWTSVCTDCAGAIDSLVELLQGRFSKGVMERICQQKTGLFPAPREIEFSCSCPDWASMCKHVAAVLYGVGARLDEQPELLFRLRKVDEKDLIAKAGRGLPLAKTGPAEGKVLAAGAADLSELFGLELGTTEVAAAPTGSKAGAKSGGDGRVARSVQPAEEVAPATGTRGRRRAAAAKGASKSGGKPKPRRARRRGVARR
ncbi:MAG: SWIM zinc finger family protein [Planctomycetota bacterium]